jgi:hypothetical protein
LTDVSDVLTASIIPGRPDDGGSQHLSNVGQFLPDYTAQHPKDSHLHTRRDNLKSQPIEEFTNGIKKIFFKSRSLREAGHTARIEGKTRRILFEKPFRE